MGERNKSINATVLLVRNTADNCSQVCLVSAEQGISWATLYGGPKSKLKSLVQPFNSGRIWLYEDKIKNSVKITDFEILNYHIKLKSNLYTIWAANLACEILMKTKCAGDAPNAYVLFRAYLDGIDSTDESGARIGTVRFLWRYLGLLGVQPDIAECSFCHKACAEDASFSPARNGIICKSCQKSADPQQKQSLFLLSKESLEYLAALNTLTPGRVRAITISADSAYQLKKLVFYLIEQAVGAKLNTLESGSTIL